MPGYTEAQRLTLKAYILADPVLGPKSSGPGTDYAFIADALNALSSPAYYIWRSNVGNGELRAACLVGGTQLDALTASKRDSLFFAIQESLDFTIASNRAAIDDFCGSQNTLKSALQAVQRRIATLAEKILASGTGSQAVPATAGWTGSINLSEIGSILA